MFRTDFLFAKPSFLEGFARVFDIGATLNVYNDSANGLEADRKALASDWCVVGQDIRSAINEYEASQEK